MSSPGGQWREWEPSGRQQANPAVDQVLAELMSDPDHLSRQLSQDLAAVAALGRTGGNVAPDLEPAELVTAVRAQADQLGFDSPVAAAAAALRHVGELPIAERAESASTGEDGQPPNGAAAVGPYHRSASMTVADGEVVREWIDEAGRIELIFHREAREPNDSGVLVEAAVRVEPSGELFLTSYGWPTRAVDRPVFSFGGTAAGYLQQLFVDLAAAAEEPRLFERAMSMAYGVTVAVNREGSLPAEVLEPAQREVLRLVVRQAALLGGYLDDAISLAEDGGLAEWMTACVRRSAAESLFAGFLGSASFELVNSEALEELESAIAETAGELPTAARRALVPVDTPPSHDWWLAEA